LHDRDHEVGPYLCRPGRELPPLIPGVSEQSLKEWEQTKHTRHDQDPAVTVLKVRQMNDRMRQKTRRIDQNMPLFAFDLLTGGVAMGVDTAALFSAFHALAVDHAGGWARLPADLLSTLHIKGVMDPPQCAVVPPALQIIVQRAPGR
jgi:hypothetical protein